MKPSENTCVPYIPHSSIRAFVAQHDVRAQGDAVLSDALTNIEQLLEQHDQLKEALGALVDLNTVALEAPSWDVLPPTFDADLRQALSVAKACLPSIHPVLAPQPLEETLKNLLVVKTAAQALSEALCAANVEAARYGDPLLDPVSGRALDALHDALRAKVPRP